jgi:hypothetical protein
LKFGDVILAVAIMAVIFVLVYSVLGIALIPSMNSYLGQNIAGLVAMLVAGLLVGFLFAGKMQEESRIRAVGKIAVLFAFVVLFVVLIGFSGNSYYGAWTKETLQGMFSTGAWTTMDWFVYEQLVTFLNLALNAVLALVLGFIGLYVGSMLRKPRKS